MVEHLEPGQRNLAVLRYSGQFSPQTDLSTYNRRAVKRHGFLLDRLIQNRAVVLPLKKGAIMLFNKKKKQAGANTVNLAGGEAFTETTQLELVALMLTSMLQNQYYRSANVTAQRLKELIAKVADKKFVAKAALYARNEAGMRSVTHLAAGELAASVKGQPWTAKFYDKVAI